MQGRHKKQSGGHGQVGDVWIEFRPNDDPTDTEFHFEDAVVGGVVPRNFIPAVEKGLRDNIKHGVLAGYPVVGLTAKLHDGSYHAVDSSENGPSRPPRASPSRSWWTLPPCCLSDLLGEGLCAGRVHGRHHRRYEQAPRPHHGHGPGQRHAVRGPPEVPLGEMFKYATDLRSMTQARGSFTMQFERYEEVPAADAKKIIENTKREEEEEE